MRQAFPLSHAADAHRFTVMRIGFQYGRLLALVFGFWLLLAAGMARAEAPGDAADPPDRVGRLADVEGKVWLYLADSDEWIDGVRNWPITTGDRLSTEASARAEIRIGTTVVRIGPDTELYVDRLDDTHAHFELLGGSLAAQLRTAEAASEFALLTEEGRFSTDRAGSYRFDRHDRMSVVTVNGGQSTYESSGTALSVHAGQRVEFWKDNGAPQYSVTSPAADAFSSWVASREQGDRDLVSTRYVSPEMTGVEDLDRYGTWEQHTDYGPLWAPRTVVAGWAPYRMGHWTWVSPWGWTWVDDAPWGFAPFHYGRWVMVHNAWRWSPGRYVARPVYAPALVAWVGGPGVSVSVRIGSSPSVGWFPLGPREVYVPGYRVSPRYVRQVNVTQVTNITNVTTIINNPGRVVANTRYMNRGRAEAVTVVPASVIQRRQPVGPSITRLDGRLQQDLSRARARADAPVVAPPSRPSAGPRGGAPRAPRPGGFAVDSTRRADTPSRSPGGARIERDRPAQTPPAGAMPPRTAERPGRSAPGLVNPGPPRDTRPSVAAPQSGAERVRDDRRPAARPDNRPQREPRGGFTAETRPAPRGNAPAPGAGQIGAPPMRDGRMQQPQIGAPTQRPFVQPPQQPGMRPDATPRQRDFSRPPEGRRGGPEMQRGGRGEGGGQRGPRGDRGG